MKKVIIMRGPSGCGKSTFVEQYIQSYDDVAKPPFAVCSADQFFVVRETQQYCFRPEELGRAHSWCFGEFLHGLGDMQSGVLFVDNTSIRHWEYANYLEAALLRSWKFEVHQFIPRTFEDAKVCIERNTHRVPRDVILRQCYEFETYDGPDAFNYKIEA